MENKKVNNTLRKGRRRHGGKYGGRVLFAIPRLQLINLCRIMLGMAVIALGILLWQRPHYLEARLDTWHQALFADVSPNQKEGLPKLTAANDDSFYLDSEKVTGWSRDFYRKIITATQWHDDNYDVSHYSDGTVFADIKGQLPSPNRSSAHDSKYEPAFTEYEWEYDDLNANGSYLTVSLSVDNASGQIIKKQVYYYE